MLQGPSYRWPGDENNQDVSSLVGKVDIRKLEFFSQNDPDAYSFSGGLNRTTQGLMEFVEMFKAPIKMLHSLLMNRTRRPRSGSASRRSDLANAGSDCVPSAL